MISWYGIAASTALVVMAVGLWFTAKSREDNPIDTVFLGTVWLVFYSIASKFPRLYQTGWDDISLSIEGLAKHGGSSLSGILIGTSLYAIALRYTMKNRPMRLDIILPWALIAHGIGRIGCMVTGCCRGVVSHLPWSITYTQNGVTSDPLHPAPGYEAIALLLCGIVLIKQGKNEDALEVTTALLGLLLYSLVRFLVDFLRAHQGESSWGLLTYTQWGAVLSAVIISYSLMKQGALRGGANGRST